MKKEILITVLALFAIIGQSFSQTVSFHQAQSYQVSEPFRNLVVKDADHNGTPDLVGHANTNTSSSRSFGILTNKSNGSFNQEQLYNSHEGDKVQDVGDFDGDGYQDVFCATYWGNGVSLYFGKAGGGFENRVFATTAVHGQVAAFVDLNNDGLQDLVNITTGSGQPNRLHIFYGNRNRSLQQKVTYETNTASAKYILPVDLNHDGRLDIAAPITSDQFLVFMQQPDGTFTHHTVNLYSVQSQRGIIFWDYNQDNYPDLVTAHVAGDSMTVRLNNGQGHFASKSVLKLNLPHPVMPTIADVNKDGLPDVVFASSPDDAWPNKLYFVQNKGNNNFSDAVLLTTLPDIAAYALADVNGDTYLDVVISQMHEPNVQVLLNKGTLTHIPTPGGAAFIDIKTTSAKKVILTPNITLQNLQLQVLDMQGRILFENTYATSAATLPIELPAPFTSGVYVVRAFTPTNKNTLKFFLP